MLSDQKHNQGKTPVAPLCLRHFPGLAHVGKDLQETGALWENQVEPGAVPRAPPLPAVVFVPVTAAQPSTGNPFKDKPLLQWVPGIDLDLKWPLETHDTLPYFY